MGQGWTPRYAVVDGKPAAGAKVPAAVSLVQIDGRVFPAVPQGMEIKALALLEMRYLQDDETYDPMEVAPVLVPEGTRRVKNVVGYLRHAIGKVQAWSSLQMHHRQSTGPADSLHTHRRTNACLVTRMRRRSRCARAPQPQWLHRR